ncbi:membrane protein insertase YidC [Glaciimonas sp. CA11.2]|uniref:membrane protein insertase YidC n=1 Tax=unclassified Glaciimonas TaxID=2644401 RepID=UPI002AB4EFB5|nr:MULTISPECIES: membrane protein insertase YidC [unclassified Glaciimonas]MDY7546096.1 membrane protein insertase YidC [Glaciimonas sp. CA11.2]MEB0010951.1 membrane protein insertase YidC [Glaciimonas sp. Cout2]MEB0081734.1 membrane protein insertase YidC [Glaciimonas sp. Gout2]MEB0161675.1 membrane protein insertase YidC [Glaciimonas sp. CA11.2]
MDIKRTVLWVVFSLSLLFLWDNWQRHNGNASMFFPNANPTAPAAGAAGAAGSTPVAGATTPGAAGNDVPQTAGVAGTASPASAVPDTAAASKGETITITTDVVKAEIDTIGGQLKRLELLKQRDTVDPTKNLVLFDSSPTRTYLADTGLIGGNFPNHKSTFVALPGARSLDNGNQVQLVLESTQGGVKLTKTFTFKRGDYAIDVKHTITNESTAAITPSLYLQLVRDGNKPEGEQRFVNTFTGAAVYTEANKFQKFAFEKIEEKKAEHATKSNDGWFAIMQHYFVSAFIPPENAPREIFTKKVATNLYAIGNVLPLGTIAPGASVTMDSRLFSGPEESAVLEATAPGLELVKDYGWLTIIAKPIFWLMTKIHKVLGNWGWTIIALTIMIKLLFFPLSAASYRSMAKMKKVTPKMTAIRERHKGEPQKMNQEMMQLYKTEKINPLGGCLPIVIQIPVFISLYWVLLASVEMRNAPWLGWIHDLAAPDPFYILPVVMAISMFIQTKLNPKPPDPMQAKVMMFMPLIFSVMFFFFPSGLVLYWITNNVLSIAQQWVITKNMESKS